jgi:16S rRNA (uracil1498-N3)-methyltransferase
MERFYCPDLSETSELVTLSAEESHHAQRVYRKKAGDSVELTDGRGLRATAIIQAIKSKRAVCKISIIESIPPPPDRNIHIALATIRPNRMDWAVEKLTELGVGSIQPLFSEFTSVKTFKTGHLRKIAVSAMKQSHQTYLPEIRSPLPFADYLQQLSSPEHSLRLIAHRAADSKNISRFQLKKKKSVLILIGPEGGFSAAEIDLARQHGFSPLHLAGQILRTETAAVTAVAQAKVYFL